MRTRNLRERKRKVKTILIEDGFERGTGREWGNIYARQGW